MSQPITDGVTLTFVTTSHQVILVLLRVTRIVECFGGSDIILRILSAALPGRPRYSHSQLPKTPANPSVSFPFRGGK